MNEVKESGHVRCESVSIAPSKGNKLLDALMSTASTPKTVTWDSCCRIIGED